MAGAQTNVEEALAYSGEPSDLKSKDLGNTYFNKGDFTRAYSYYTEAIYINRQNPVYYTNRALTLLKMKKFKEAGDDCRTALSLDSGNVKAHFYLGQALCETQSIDDGILHLQNSADLCRKQRKSFGDEVTEVLRFWRRKRFEIVENKRLTEEIDLQYYLSRLIQEDNIREVEKVKAEHGSSGEMIAESPELVEKISKINEASDDRLAQLNSMFSLVDEKRRRREVPDYLCGKISFELLRDPVVTPCGITYERKDIEDHLLRVGHFDPVTRVALTSDQLIPNYAMKEVVDNFVSENEWALDY